MAMIGIWMADRRQAPGANYWAIAELLISTGIAVILYDHGASLRPVLIVANTCIIWGLVMQYWGLQSFYAIPKARLGAVIGLSYFTLYIGLLYVEVSVATRVVLFSLTVLLLVTLTLRLNLQKSRHAPTLGSRLVTAALILVLANNLLRVVAAIATGDQMQVASQSTLNVILLYIVPLTCVVLYSVGLLLLYFERSLREQRYLASHDGLTGVLNRRAVVEAGADILARSVQQNTPLSVALVDIDFFKRFNDELGHHVGDQVLVEVARLLTGHCRRNDLLGRYGGEEFLLVLPGMPAHECPPLGERLTGAVRQYRHHDRPTVTISAGFASLERGDSWKSLLSRADTQLYRAKALGRDQYCVDEACETPHTRSAAPSEPPFLTPIGQVVQFKKSDKT